jgi:hypothetical protein
MRKAGIVEACVLGLINVAILTGIFWRWKGLQEFQSEWPKIVLFGVCAVLGILPLGMLWRLFTVPPKLKTEDGLNIKTLGARAAELEDAIPTAEMGIYLESDGKDLFLRVRNLGKQSAKFAGRMINVQCRSKGKESQFTGRPYQLQWGNTNVDIKDGETANWVEIGNGTDNDLHVARLGGSSIQGRDHLQNTNWAAGAELTFFSATGVKTPQCDVDYREYVTFRVGLCAKPSLSSIVVEKTYQIKVIPNNPNPLESVTSWQPKWDADSFREIEVVNASQKADAAATNQKGI